MPITPACAIQELQLRLHPRGLFEVINSFRPRKEGGRIPLGPQSPWGAPGKPKAPSPGGDGLRSQRTSHSSCSTPEGRVKKFNSPFDRVVVKHPVRLGTHGQSQASLFLISLDTFPRVCSFLRFHTFL